MPQKFTEFFKLEYGILRNGLSFDHNLPKLFFDGNTSLSCFEAGSCKFLTERLFRHAFFPYKIILKVTNTKNERSKH